MKFSTFFTNFIIATCLIFSIQNVLADLSDDAEEIFNDAQQVYPVFFPSMGKTESLDPWIYRFYPDTGVYLGVNKNDQGVYVLGGNFGDSPTYVDHKDTVITMLTNQKNAFELFCNNTPDGASCEQNGYLFNQSTHGQCLKIPDTNPTQVETGISVQFKVETTKLQLNGFKTNSANRSAIIDAVLQSGVNQCIIHPQGTPPENLTRYTMNIDICSDETDDFETLASQPDTAEFNRPITLHIIGTGRYTYVDDCFASDAVGIINRVTKERWLRNSKGEFVKL